jgi:hypothetical protein
MAVAGGAFVRERPSLFNAFDREYFIVDMALTPTPRRRQALS